MLPFLKSGNFDEQLMLVILTLTVCLSLLWGFESDSCEKERNCTVQLNSSTSLYCIVGKRTECNNVQLSRNPPVYGSQMLYPYLATVSIYKRYDEKIDAVNFSFLVPPSDISGVMAEFVEAPGFNNNSHYKVPICRFFNFSSTSALLPETFGAQLEIPYTCIGISITPSVFHLNLTSVPSSHLLNYVISWHEHGSEMYEHYYNDFNDVGGQTRMSVWVEQVVAVAVVHVENIIHAVFQPPRTDSGVSFLLVSLVGEFTVFTSKQVEPFRTNVKFTQVPPGKYQVVLSPKGDACHSESNACTDIASEYVFIVSGHADEKKYVTVGLICVSIGLVILGIGVTTLLLRRKLRKIKGLDVNSIFITSMACRELEKNVTSYFCSFLSVTLHTSVTFTLPLLHPNESKFIKADTTNHEKEAQQNLLLQTHESFTCYIILQFYYPTKCCLLTSTCESQSYLSESHLCSKGCWKRGVTSIRDILQGIPSEQAYIVTFMQEGDSAGSGIAYTLQKRSEYGTVSDDITVLNDHLSNGDDVSLCNRVDKYTDKNNIENVKEYLLPCEISELYEDLKSRLTSKMSYLPSSKIIINKYWRLALTVFHKAAENQPSNTIDIYNPITSDAITIAEIIPQTDCVRAIIQNTSLNMSQKPGQSHTVPDFLSYDKQIQTYNADNSISLEPITAVERASYETKECVVVKNHPTSVSKSTSSQDSYSNVTDAENDMRLQFIQNQSRKYQAVPEVRESLSTGDNYRGIEKTRRHAEDTAVDNDFPLKLCQGQTYRRLNNEECILPQSHQCSKVCQFVLSNTSQWESTQFNRDYKDTMGNNALCVYDSCSARLGGCRGMGRCPGRATSPNQTATTYGLDTPNDKGTSANTYHHRDMYLCRDTDENNRGATRHRDTTDHIDTYSDYREIRSADRNMSYADSNVHSSHSNVNSADSNVHSTDMNMHYADCNVHSADSNVHSADSNVYSADSNVNSADSNVHSADMNMHYADSNVHSADSNVNSADSNVHSADRNMHSADSNVHSADWNMHSADSNVHSADMNMHYADSNVHSADSNVNSADSNVHSADMNMHSADSNVHSADWNTHSIDRNTHSLDRNTHFADKNTHSNDRNTHHTNLFPANIRTLPVYRVLLPANIRKDHKQNQKHIADNVHDVDDCSEQCKSHHSPMTGHDATYTSCPVQFSHSLIPPQFI